jgi:predicted Rossmann-fold nucleotide-binding protein
MVKEGTIAQADLDRFIITDSAQEAVESIMEIAKRAFGLTYGSRMRKRWFFGER